MGNAPRTAVLLLSRASVGTGVTATIAAVMNGPFLRMILGLADRVRVWTVLGM